MRNFIAPPSFFRSITTGLKEAYGEWMPEYYKYIMIEKTQFLLVSNKQTVVFQGVEYTLTLRQGDIKGMMRLANQGSYWLHYKQFA